MFSCMEFPRTARVTAKRPLQFTEWWYVAFFCPFLRLAAEHTGASGSRMYIVSQIARKPRTIGEHARGGTPKAHQIVAEPLQNRRLYIRSKAC